MMTKVMLLADKSNRCGLSQRSEAMLSRCQVGYKADVAQPVAFGIPKIRCLASALSTDHFPSPNYCCSAQWNFVYLELKVTVAFHNFPSSTPTQSRWQIVQTFRRTLSGPSSVSHSGPKKPCLYANALFCRRQQCLPRQASIRRWRSIFPGPIQPYQQGHPKSIWFYQ